MKKTLLSLVVLASLSFVSAINANAAVMYDVKITNITKGITFTPFIVASHQRPSSLFTLGEAASSDLEAIAEGGDTSGLQSTLESASSLRVRDIGTSTGTLAPGASTTVTVKAGRLLTIASMLLPTNDAFVALRNGSVNVRSLRRGGTETFTLRAYDAGTEVNDEACDSIPGPALGACPGGGTGGTDENGFVHVSSGIRGAGELVEADHDWKNPVAIVTVTRSLSTSSDDSSDDDSSDDDSSDE